MNKALQPNARGYKASIVAAWSSFDFANSSFSAIIVTFVYPIYFGETIVTNGRGDFYWGIAMSLSMLLVALVSPALGAMADLTGSKKKFLAGFTLLSVLATAGMFFLSSGMVIAGILLFVLGNAGFEGGTVFYDAFLPEISEPKTFGRISGIGFAVGYFGSLAALVITKVMLAPQPPLLREIFLVTALFFLLFSLPTLIWVPEHKRSSRMKLGATVRAGFARTMETLRTIRQYPNVARFLIAFFVYNDAILTVIGFSGRYAKRTLHFDTGDLAMFFIMIQVIAAIGSVIFGYITDRKGARFTILITLAIWIAVVFGAYVVESAAQFWYVGAVAGLALGSSQSASRSLMAALTPKEHTAQFFGFYDGLCGKASAVVGPFLYGVLSDSFGQRPAIASLAFFFVAGFILLRGVTPTLREPNPH